MKLTIFGLAVVATLAAIAPAMAQLTDAVDLPEPGTITMLGAGLAALVLARGLRRKR